MCYASAQSQIWLSGLHAALQKLIHSVLLRYQGMILDALTDRLMPEPFFLQGPISDR
jgi:hypothetical protein